MRKQAEQRHPGDGLLRRRKKQHSGDPNGEDHAQEELFPEN